MKLAIAIVVTLVALAVLWRLLHLALGLAMGLVWIAMIAAVAIFVVGLFRRLIRM